MRMLTSCVDKLYYTPLFNVVYSVDHRISVDQRICWCESTPPKLPDVYSDDELLSDFDNINLAVEGNNRVVFYLKLFIIQ